VHAIFGGKKEEKKKEGKIYTFVSVDALEL